MTSHSLIKKCANETCGRNFVPTEDDRQKHCSRSCARAQASRRYNRKKREKEELRIRRYWEHLEARQIRPLRRVISSNGPVAFYTLDLSARQREVILHHPILLNGEVYRFVKEN